MRIKPIAAPIAALAALTMVGTMPSVAQPGPGRWNGPNGWDREGFWRGAPDDPYARIDFLQHRIDRGVADGSLDRHEARASEIQLNRIRQRVRQLRHRNGWPLNAHDRAFIQTQLDSLGQQIRWRRHNEARG